MNEYILYIRMMKNGRIVIGKMRPNSLNGFLKKDTGAAGWKLIYFESRKSMRSAQMLERKFSSMTRASLLNEIRKSNPELLDLKYALSNTNLTQEVN